MKSYIQLKQFKEINLNDYFFNSLRLDYLGFNSWFIKKANEYVFIQEEEGKINAFLYLKEEDGNIEEITPILGYNLESKKRMKIGTFKIEAHGTKMGENFMQIILKEAIRKEKEEIYVTIFEKQLPLINLFEKFGFIHVGYKGNERVYIKDLRKEKNNVYFNFPKISNELSKKAYLLSINPPYHSKLFPYSSVNTERDFFQEDLSFQNSIEKVYLSGISGIETLKSGDLLVIYRTKEKFGSAEYTSVATSICTVVEVKDIKNFSSEQDFFDYVGKFTIFTFNELRELWYNRKYPIIIKMIYNIALDHRIIKKDLHEKCEIPRDSRYFGFFELNRNQFNQIIKEGIKYGDYFIR